MKNILYFGLLLIFQCQNTKAQTWSAVGNGTNNFVYALAAYDSVLYAGGDFNIAGSMPVKNIAQWNGTDWDTISQGIDGPVYALTVYKGKLYAGGYFSNAGGHSASCIAVWDGKNWSGIGAGFYGGAVYAISFFNDTLYAGGAFYASGDKTDLYIAKWDGVNWDSLDYGLYGDEVFALFSFNGYLYVGGTFQGTGYYGSSHRAYGIARWNGVQWDTLWDLLNGAYGSVYSFNEYKNNLIIAGAFSLSSPDANIIAYTVFFNYAYLGSGIQDYLYDFVNTTCVYNGNLYAGGKMDSAGLNPVNNIAEWNGKNWLALGSGLNATALAMAVYNGDLYVGGEFTMAGGNPASYIARWGNPSGIESVIKNQSIKVYPNPANGKFTIEYLSSGWKGSEIYIYNIYGQIIDEVKAGTPVIGIDLGNQPAGLYLYRITSEEGNEISSGKIIVE